MAVETQLQELAGLAIARLHDFLLEGGHDSGDVGEARVATSVLNSWVRLRQTESARDATMFMVARELAEDKSQLRRYLEVAMPSAPIVRALPERVLVS